MRGILQEKVYKACITDLYLSTTPLTNGCRSHDMIQLRSQLLFHFVQISVKYRSRIRYLGKKIREF